MKILIAIILIFSSCNFSQFGRGVQNYFIMARKRTEEYLIHLTHVGRSRLSPKSNQDVGRMRPATPCLFRPPASLSDPSFR